MRERQVAREKGEGAGGRGGERGKEWFGELEQRKLITCPVAFSWFDYLARERE